MVTTVSEAQIGNMALDLLLQTNEEVLLDIVTPTTETEQILKRWYDPARRAVLRKRIWNFAKTRIILTKVTGTGSTPVFGFENKHNLPNDFIRFVKLSADSDLFAPRLSRERYTLENNQILSDVDGNLFLIYIRDFTSTGFFDPLFVIHLAVELAWYISYKITGSNVNRESLMKIADETMSAASSVDAAEEPPRRIEESVPRDLRRRRFSGRRTTFWF